MKQVIGFAAIAMILCAALPVSAGTVIVDNTGDVGIATQPTSNTLSVGQGFTMGGTSELLGKIAAAVTPGAHLALYTEGTIHNIPISLITGLTDTGTQNTLGDEIYIASSPVTLLADQAYSVVMSGNGFSWSSTIGGATNLLGTMDTGYTANEGGGWFDLSSGGRLRMQVNLQPASVPEPSTIVTSVVGLMICGAAGFHRRRRGLLRIA
jgi:hypothetical protein